MVLSNKKLKQKLRSLLAESLAANEFGDPPGDAASGGGVDLELQSLKQLLGSKSHQPSFSKKGKKRKKLSLSEESKPIEETEETQKENEDDNPEKSKKRKREGGNEKSKVGKKKKKKDRKREKLWWEIKKERKKKKEERAEREAEKSESTSGERNETAVGQPVNDEQSEQNAKKVYVGGIPYYSTEDDIKSFFEGCGTVTEVYCMKFPESGKFRGIAILSFKTEAAAKRALALDGADMGGFYLKIQPYKGSGTHRLDFAPEIVEGYNRIYVGNLSWDITEDDLRKLFSHCNISSIRFGMDKETGDFKGYAHVDFSDNVSLMNALKLDQEVVCGRQVRIRCAVPRKTVENSSRIKPADKKAEDGTGSESTKSKRRTCYECGVRGHLSSSCPRKKARETMEPLATTDKGIDN